VDSARRPEDVFPWLLEQDKVPQWTGDLQRYEVSGPLGNGTRVKQVLDIAGGLTLDLVLTQYDPPRGAASTFSTNGVNVVTTYTLEPTTSGTRLTQTLDAKASGLTARMLIPVVQGRLEKKVVEDLDRLRGVLGG
jgi:hypothetical protein